MQDQDTERMTAVADVEQLLAEITAGGQTEQLFLVLYQELRMLAGQKMARERPGQTLTPTALVHDAYLRLLKGRQIGWDSRGHFFSAAAEAMRRILVERAREKATAKRGHGVDKVAITTIPNLGEQDASELLDLDQALQGLEQLDKSMAQVVKLRYFAGLTVDETAEAMGQSPRTINRHWTAARAWLNRELSSRVQKADNSD